MRDANPRALLYVLVAVVPVIVAGAFVVAIGLQRAGFGLVVWALLPFGVSRVVIGVLGVLLGRAATRGAQGGRRSGKDDGV